MLRIFLLAGCVLGAACQGYYFPGELLLSNLCGAAKQCSLSQSGAQMRCTTRPFAQWNLILAHLQHSKCNIVYIYRVISCIYTGHVALKCFISCAFTRVRNCMLKQIFALWNILLGTLTLRIAKCPQLRCLLVPTE